ncbi:MAG: CotH kinase family protein [Bacteroidales bacterium]|nr:CotH kinase family protein [Bacteroidales bacterium]
MLKHAVIISFLLIFINMFSRAQEFTDSNLPIVIITTPGVTQIVDNPRIIASMKIIDRGNGERNYLTDVNNPAFLNYNGKIEIEIRGSSTQTRPKKQYGFSTLLDDNKTNNNVSLLGMPPENDWILNGMVFDPSLMRDYLSYNLSRMIGEYASRTAYCELVINGTYKGLYLLQEKIKADDNRVDISDISKTDNTLPNLTGGYIIKADKTTGGDPIAWTMYSSFGAAIGYIHEQPEPDEITSVQSNYIKTQFQVFETSAFYSLNSDLSEISDYIDIPSFIDYMLINELASNADAYMFSTFFHKDRNGKLRAGPVWDCDLTYGNDIFIWGFNRSKTNVWQFSNGDNEGSRFWRDLFRNKQFNCYMSKRWNELTKPGQPLNTSVIESFLNQTRNKINEAAIRDNALWSSVGNLQEEVSKIKTFLNVRTEWINGNIGSSADCENIPVPPLVISGIMYHPPSSVSLTESDDHEFIEITNNGDKDINMDGIYFSGTGFVYQFPFYSTMKSNSSIILAGNIMAFRTKYGTDPFGQFTRHLSNKGQKIVLADRYGNVIDEVHYSDTIPWPDADGNGKYLKLKDPGLDNTIPENWSASDDIVVSDRSVAGDDDLTLYPNPAEDLLRVAAPSEIKQVSFYSIQGQLLKEEYVNSLSYESDLHSLPAGIYILKIRTSDKVYTRKIVKY